MRRPVAGVGQETHPVGLGSVGGPHLSPVDHVLIPVLHRLGGDTWVEEAELKSWNPFLRSLKHDGSFQLKKKKIKIGHA